MNKKESDIRIVKHSDQVDYWGAEDGYLYTTFEVNHTDGFIHHITRWDSEDDKYTITNWELRAILKILEAGGYKLE